MGNNGTVPPDMPFTPNTDELVRNNVEFSARFADQGLAVEPRRRLAVVACMDSRMDIFEMLGLDHGDAHIVRNAGGVVTDDVVRSLVVSQRLLGTREILLVHHTDCGLQKITEDAFKRQIELETGVKPRWAVEAFADPFEDVRQSMARVSLSPFVLHKDHIRGFVYDVDNGRLVEVTPDV